MLVLRRIEDGAARGEEEGALPARVGFWGLLGGCGVVVLGWNRTAARGKIACDRRMQRHTPTYTVPPPQHDPRRPSAPKMKAPTCP